MYSIGHLDLEAQPVHPGIHHLLYDSIAKQEDHTEDGVD